MNNKQRWMGGVVLLGGGVLLAALLLKGKDEIHQQDLVSPQVAHPVEQARLPENQSSASDVITLQPLTVDVETEKRLLEEQKRAREKAVAEQEAQTAEYLRNQQKVEADAARKAAEEYAAMNARRKGAQESSDNIPPELTAEAKAKLGTQKTPEQRAVEQKAAEQKKLEQKQQQNTDAAKKAEQQRLADEQKRKAEASQKAQQAKLAEDQKRKAEASQKAQQAEDQKRKAEANQKAQDAKLAEEQKRKAQEAAAKKADEQKRKTQEETKKKAEAEQARDILENGDKQWMVQVALAANQANADSLASKLRAKGYKVTQSPTSKGVRIMVGPSKNKDSADGLRKKINTDASLNMKSAWVIEWVPLEQR